MDMVEIIPRALRDPNFELSRSGIIPSAPTACIREKQTELRLRVRMSKYRASMTVSANQLEYFADVPLTVENTMMATSDPNMGIIRTNIFQFRKICF